MFSQSLAAGLLSFCLGSFLRASNFLHAWLKELRFLDVPRSSAEAHHNTGLSRYGASWKTNRGRPTKPEGKGCKFSMS